MERNLVELSETVAALAARGAPSVVRVEARRGPPFSGMIWSRDGVIVTADHALETDEDAQVGLPDGTALPAEVIGRDPSTDLAAIRVRAGGLAAPELAQPEGLAFGQLVVGVSRPGRTPRASLGLLARVGGEWRAPSGGRIDRYLETTLDLHAGFSGTVAFCADGRAVGLATAGLVRGAALVVPAPTLRRVIESLLAHGQVRRGYLGVATVPVRLPPALEAQVGQAGALLVSAVEADSPAARGGVLLGDALVSLAGEPVAAYGDLLPVLEEDRIGEALPVRIVRAGAVQELSVTVSARPGRCGR